MYRFICDQEVSKRDYLGLNSWPKSDSKYELFYVSDKYSGIHSLFDMAFIFSLYVRITWSRYIARSNDSFDTNEMRIVY